MNNRQSLLVALDLTTTLADLGPVLRLARATQWPVYLLHAAAPEPSFLGYDAPGGVYDDRRRSAELNEERANLANLRTYFTREGLEAESHIIVGPTIEVILSQADTWDAAMIVVVGRSHNVVRRVVLGSVAATLLKVATRPVLVLPGSNEENTGFSTAVDRLISVIDRDDADLADLREAAESQLAEPESTEQQVVLGGRLREALSRFETDHPSLTRAINDVGYYLSGTGV